MRENLISVIIPVYNTAEYLPRCLDSILNNTYRELEVICVNDGSRDNSLEVLNRYAAQDSRIKVIDQENAGVSAARNHGLDAAAGEYIAFVDSDDWVHRQYFEVLLTQAQRYDAEISCCGGKTVSTMVSDAEIDPDGLSASALVEVPLIENSYVVWGRLYKSEIIGSHRFDSRTRLSEDTLFNLQIIHDAPRICLVKSHLDLYYYFMRSDSAIHTLEPRENETLIRWYLEHFDCASPSSVRSYYLTKGIKHLFVWRYHARFSPDPTEAVRVQQMIDRFAAALQEHTSNDIPNRRVLLLFARSPGFYRIFRILHDPTMLRWEKNQRKKMKSAKERQS